MYKVHTEVLEKCKKQLEESNTAISAFNTAVSSNKEASKKLYKDALSKLNKLYDNNEKLIKLLEDNYHV
jgi:hypothetical protein